MKIAEIREIATNELAERIEAEVANYNQMVLNHSISPLDNPAQIKKLRRTIARMKEIKTPDLGGINNTIEAVLYCKEKGIGAYQGGTCNETDRSAQVCTQCAMATQPVQILAKPGMGVDEGYMIVYNEMQRILAVRRAKQAK